MSCMFDCRHGWQFWEGGEDSGDTGLQPFLFVSFVYLPPQ